jgi:hypothetical protein
MGVWLCDSLLPVMSVIHHLQMYISHRRKMLHQHAVDEYVASTELGFVDQLCSVANGSGL